jgi:hypothetical protein
MPAPSYPARQQLLDALLQDFLATHAQARREQLLPGHRLVRPRSSALPAASAVARAPSPVCSPRQGIQCVDTDAISRELTAAGGQALAAICQHFGAHLLDTRGALDRAAMRQLVFSDTDSQARA